MLDNLMASNNVRKYISSVNDCRQANYQIDDLLAVQCTLILT